MPNEKTKDERVQDIMASPDYDNMELWDEVCESDPKYVTYCSSHGGYHSIKAQIQRKAATEKFGFYGMGWGISNLVWACDEKENILDAYFWYIWKGEKFGFPMRVSAKPAPGYDPYKKLLTDLTTKALSMLGFNSDVHQGLYKDPAYMDSMKKKFYQNNKDEEEERAIEEEINNEGLEDIRESCRTLANEISELRDLSTTQAVERIRGGYGVVFGKIERMGEKNLKKLQEALEADIEAWNKEIEEGEDDEH
ncbi:MAG: hypothetical protein KAU20_03265 [Nanoarchaeota archaeon]|nr:hypothetical protein [Nanoarchaeota archaeon]